MNNEFAVNDLVTILNTIFVKKVKMWFSLENNSFSTYTAYIEAQAGCVITSKKVGIVINPNPNYKNTDSILNRYCCVFIDDEIALVERSILVKV